jgi:hypothetical protein
LREQQQAVVDKGKLFDTDEGQTQNQSGTSSQSHIQVTKAVCHRLLPLEPTHNAQLQLNADQQHQSVLLSTTLSLEMCSFLHPSQPALQFPDLELLI